MEDLLNAYENAMREYQEFCAQNTEAIQYLNNLLEKIQKCQNALESYARRTGNSIGPIKVTQQTSVNVKALEQLLSERPHLGDVLRVKTEMKRTTSAAAIRMAKNQCLISEDDAAKLLKNSPRVHVPDPVGLPMPQKGKLAMIQVQIGKASVALAHKVTITGQGIQAEVGFYGETGEVFPPTPRNIPLTSEINQATKTLLELIERSVADLVGGAIPPTTFKQESQEPNVVRDPEASRPFYPTTLSGLLATQKSGKIWTEGEEGTLNSFLEKQVR